MRNLPRFISITFVILALTGLMSSVFAQSRVERFAVFEGTFKSSGKYQNPYTELEAVAEIKSPGGDTDSIPLFWDGGNNWKLRISPDTTGKWSFAIQSKDRGLNGKRGSFECTPSNRSGSIEPMQGYPHHFQRQDGSPFLFWGDTAWGLYLDKDDENLNRDSVFRYIDKRGAEGVNVMHSMLLSEAGWGNNGGPPFDDIGDQTINPAYWREVDLRLRYLNDRGIVGGLAIAWGDKGRGEPYSWGRFPSLEARKRYALYIAARYSAFEVYFIVSGEWNLEIRNRKNTTEDEVRSEFIELGNVLEAADTHGRMIGMHPGTAPGTVSEFNSTGWMGFGDYQQNYKDLHNRILQRRTFRKPVINSEYGYYLRDSNGDGKVDKDNSMNAQDMRYATWDILLAGGYPVTGYGPTYMGGFRDPGPFNPDDPRNDVWTARYRLAKHFLSSLEWWKLEPHDDRIHSTRERSEDRKVVVQASTARKLSVGRPPQTTYWLLADTGRTYVAYARGLTGSINLQLGEKKTTAYRGYNYNPRSGETEDLGELFPKNGAISWTPPDDEDWVLLLKLPQ